MRLREVSMAAADHEATATLLARLFGAEASPQVEVGVPPVQARFRSMRCGDVSFAVMASTEAGSPIARFLEARGDGLFSITFEVEDITAAMTHFRDCGAVFVLDQALVLTDYSTGHDTYRECLVNFTRPKTTGGIVIELQEFRR